METMKTETTPAIRALSIEECWSNLRSQQLGRVTITTGGRPYVFPVNFTIGGRTIVFRTESGMKLDHGPGSIACFEVDDFEESTGEGWSVMAFGILEDITQGDDARSRTLRQLPLKPVAPGMRRHWMAMLVTEITGRHITIDWTVPGAFLG